MTIIIDSPIVHGVPVLLSFFLWYRYKYKYINIYFDETFESQLVTFRHFTTKYSSVTLRTRTFCYVNHNPIPPLNKYSISITLMSNLGFIVNVSHYPHPL